MQEPACIISRISAGTIKKFRRGRAKLLREDLQKEASIRFLFKEDFDIIVELEGSVV
jgi:hypothetical protein